MLLKKIKRNGLRMLVLQTKYQKPTTDGENVSYASSEAVYEMIHATLSEKMFPSIFVVRFDGDKLNTLKNQVSKGIATKMKVFLAKENVLGVFE